jgi:Domain of Unknown Function (DUF1080)
MRSRKLISICVLCGAAIAGAVLYAQQQHSRPGIGELGYDDTPQLPGQKWRVHDIDRPHPGVVTPGAEYGNPPSDAVVLFDGKDFSHWHQRGQNGAPKWKIENGYMEIVGGTGDMLSNEKFGTAQYHVEWSEPADLVQGTSQGRGNSGVIIMDKYEIQVLDTLDNKTYADGQAGAIYGQWPPMVNPIRPAGQWNVYDIVFEAPKFEAGKLVKPAYVTLFFNGVAVHNRQEVVGPMAHREIHKYQPHGVEEPFCLQDHDPTTHVRYRNIWARKLKGYDAQ